MRTRLSAAACAVLLSLVGCATGPPGYWTNRGRDLTDVLHVDVVPFSFGAAANVGPLILGYFEAPGFFGYADRTMLGLGGLKSVSLGGSAVTGVLVPLSRVESQEERTNLYTRRRPGWGSIGFDLGWAFSVGVHLDLVEFVDLVVGVVGVDLLDDDLSDDDPPADEVQEVPLMDDDLPFEQEPVS